MSAFLASVRRTRFVDYLDPLGETAQNALERRLSWARVSQHDPAYADEARFLLDNAESLRDIVRRELEEDDWIEEADVGREWETRLAEGPPSRAGRMRENDRVTEIFQADDIEIGASGARPSGRSSAGKAPAPRGGTPGPNDSRSGRSGGEASRPGAEPQGRSGPSRTLRSTPPPGDARPAARSTPQPSPEGRRSGRDAPLRSEVARRSETADLVQQEPPRARGTRADPPPRRSSVSTARNMPGSANNSLPPIGRDDDPPTARGRGDLGKRSGSPGRFQTPVAAEVSLDEDEATTPMRRSEVAAEAARLAARAKSKSEAPIQEVDLDDWESPDDPASSTGIMRIEDVVSSGSDHTVIADNHQPMVRPQPMAAAAAVLDDAATRPSAATRLRRPDTSRSAGPMPRSSLRAEPARRRSRLPMLAMLVVALGVVALGAGSVIAVPILYSQTNGFTDLSGAFQPAPPPKPEAPKPEAPTPDPSQAGAGAPAPADPAGAAGAASGDPAGSPAPAPSDAPGAATQPAPSPAPTATPQPTIGKAPPDPQPDLSSAPPVRIEGVWIGSTKPKDKSLKITVLTQDDGTFSGSVMVQLEDDTFTEYDIAGTIDGAGILTFRGGGMTFTGRVERRQVAKGTYSTRPGGPSSEWSANRG